MGQPINASVVNLRRQLEALTPRDHTWLARGQLALGVPAIDTHLKGGLPLGLLHEAYAGETADMAATSGFAAALVQRATLTNRSEDARSVVWIRQTMSESETGRLYPHGLSGIGLNPANLISVRVNKPIHLLSAGLEAVRCASLSAVIIEAWGSPKELDLTATRRLALAAEHSGTTPFLLRAATEEQASTAFTRWQVRAAPSRALAASAPGYPTFDITLLRNKAGTHGQSWRVEWHHELGQFKSIATEQAIQHPANTTSARPLPGESVSGGVVSVSARRPIEARGKPLARTG